MYDYLISNGVIVRNRNRVRGCEGCLRLTVGIFSGRKRTPSLTHRKFPIMLKKAIFIDRDGTIIKEPADEQIVSAREARIRSAGAISGLRSLMNRGDDIVMVSNQDGLGTDSFPEDNSSGLPTTRCSRLSKGRE